MLGAKNQRHARPPGMNTVQSTRPATWALWIFSLAFLLRVVGQAVQRWLPQRWLPPFEAFQGSSLPYFVLLTVQIIILFFMLRTAIRAGAGTLRSNRRAGRLLGIAGSIYLFVSLARIAVGLAVTSAPDWFRTWIPAVFHVVLAAYVVVLARYHLQADPRAP
jgi:hypothetical protein